MNNVSLPVNRIYKDRSLFDSLFDFTMHISFKSCQALFLQQDFQILKILSKQL